MSVSAAFEQYVRNRLQRIHQQAQGGPPYCRPYIVPQKRPRISYNRLNLYWMQDSMCIYLFHFSLKEIQMISSTLGLPSRCEFGHLKVESDFGFAVLIHRYISGRSLKDLSLLFGMSPTSISTVCTGMQNLIYDKIKWGIQFDTRQFSPANLEIFSEAILAKGASFPNIVGFIDGLVKENSYAKGEVDFTRDYYNGWKHFHSVKFQSIVTPDGITNTLIGPFVGRKKGLSHYTTDNAEKRIEKYLQLSPNREDWFAFYGSPAGIECANIFKPFDSETKDDIEIKSNRCMAKNMLHCVNRTKRHTSTFFNVPPPKLEDYIAGLMRGKIEGEDEDDPLIVKL
ncbi:hypothetical protein PHYBLDRAFT_149801 [Phycomyces blakesleeanus NRRL 1555(-)]|uniref:DDE Tnp4 domain-containing protein n=1 Tax=Phycomyces blakesleeanus (strain ATCC 8743b / DSM 1359 / FGSC 10004 / NBRC 33097 / NRRL 1555) TaxID=763407 RepID=A0A167L208_PHYB8|nr:hypothetical protein PHYBLDRAFT_149801 [Phycomyces blakesleeanus NRRL 1555(-)]OAD69409.1 hypothetical protein PHYBLDRAFT_149801 [Phycomyces blakesleeanus NRRL 1555(-)]|eukprot:XP_018287449.1 hypothetical protein PHYBLDRAFT_149801 [Phycomyces blakesleeanus NRRL 1555(-)]